MHGKANLCALFTVPIYLVRSTANLVKAMSSIYTVPVITNDTITSPHVYLLTCGNAKLRPFGASNNRPQQVIYYYEVGCPYLLSNHEDIGLKTCYHSGHILLSLTIFAVGSSSQSRIQLTGVQLMCLVIPRQAYLSESCLKFPVRLVDI